MDYSFNTEIAILYGVDEAIFIQNLYFWILKNEANGRHFYEGKNWTYNSIKAFSKLFPFWSERQMQTVIRKCKEKGAIYTGNFNETTYDRTTWYALTETVKSIYVKCEMDFTKTGNGFTQNVGPIPYIKPNKKPVSKPIEYSYQNIMSFYNDICQSFPRLTLLSESRKKSIKARLNSGYTLEDFKRLFEMAESSDFLKGKNDRDWSATFDWLIKDGNMAKVLDGNYKNKFQNKENSFTDDFKEILIERGEE